ncbi:MAG: nitrite/sulfite reductase [Gammaproteobacteria bacterium]|nr:nitrite/sulfite reductase [Gammaproteobacteria bacterium]MCP5460066.1 nitrite/sulfite reductase [Gammaproteobacteria bacterium]
MTVPTWKERLADRVPDDLTREIDIFETQLDLKRQGKMEDKLFAETRLRRGVYGQRYDNGQRHDGLAHQRLEFSSSDLTKGPETLWDAPGMQRIKIPFGGLNPEQMDELADLAEEYSDAICHVTTRQDIQLHYVHIEDTPDMMRRLAAVGITTREACGNSVRNVTACPIAGVCHGETFDVTPYAKACAQFLLGHPDTQDFGRKFKVAFSGCKHNACGLTTLHDLGFIARTRLENGSEQRGFEMYVGGGLGAVPYEAKLFDEFVPEDEILPMAQAISRVFARLGEKRNRGRARVKFLIEKLGIERFRELVLEERKTLPFDPAWAGYLEELPAYGETPLKPGLACVETSTDPEFLAWRNTNVYAQKQAGYAVATVTLPLGDITSWQMRQLADIARRYVGDTIRATVEQNIVLRWVPEADLPALYQDLKAVGLGKPGAGTLLDVTACPGTDTCKLGIASSRGLAAELIERLAAQAPELDETIKGLHIKLSGCFNACGQHHLADLGFYGVSRKVGNTTVPHFRVVLGGQWEENAGSYGVTIGAVPSKRIPEFIKRLTDYYVQQRQTDESFRDFTRRLGKKALKALVDEMAVVPAYEVDRSFYSDWRDPREFTISDIGVGECAGAIVPRIHFDLQTAEQTHFEAQLLFDSRDYRAADETAYKAMLEAAKGLIRLQFQDIGDDPEQIVAEFRQRFFDTELFHDKYAGGKFAHYLFHRHQDTERVFDEEKARYLLEETQLFIEAAYACHGRLLEQGAVAAAPALGGRTKTRASA